MKLFAAVICHYSMVILTFSVIKLYYLGNYHGMAVNYHGKKFITLIDGGNLKYSGYLPRNFNPINVGTLVK